MQPTTWLLWTGPFILLVAGIIALMAYLRRRSRAVQDAPLSADDAKRAEALLKEDGQ
jgi:cytochrome c-type biogenesis protein CcmH